MQTALERIGGYVNLYNEARTANDVAGAIKYGRLAVRDAKEELQKPDLNNVHKEYFLTVVSSIAEFLANPVLVRPSVKKVEEESEIESTDWFSAPVPNLKMKDVAGLRDCVDELIVNVFAPLTTKYGSIYKKYRGEAKGLQVLLYGPPGTGKTHLVKCLAGELGCKCAVVQIKDALANLVGDGAKIIAEIFSQANQYDKCIIFLDEIDAIAANRDDEESRHTKEQLTELLTCLDGFTSKVKPGQIRIVVAATNRPEALDPALKRGGRFDTQIFVPLPDEDARRHLIKRAMGKDESVKDRVDVPCAEDLTVDWLVEKTDAYAGADIQAICRQATNLALKREIIAASKGRSEPDRVTRQDFEEVLGRYINPITVEMLMKFDAYRQNKEYDLDYVRLKCDQIIRLLYNGKSLPKWERVWFEDLYKRDYVNKEFSTKYDLTFLREVFD